MEDEVTVTITVSRKALIHAAEVIDETGDEFGPGMCPFPDSEEWVEFKDVFAKAVDAALKR